MTTTAHISELPQRPVLAPGVELRGELTGSGYRDRQWLIERDGRFLQVSELLYRVAEHADGKRTFDEIAAMVTEATEWRVTAGDVRRLIGRRLMPLRLIASDDEPAPSTGASPSAAPLQLRMRARVAGPRMIAPITKALQVLFAPPLILAVVAGAVWARSWLYFAHGLGGAVRATLFRPGLLLALLGIVLAAAVFHELGHASALRYGGGRARGIGVGIYLIYPVFYTDTTDAYRLGRWGRVRTDLGGIYFHIVASLAIFAAVALTHQEFLLLAVVMIDFEVLRQFTPFVRLDGYWLLADLTGVPDFFSQAGPFLRSIVPIRRLRGDGLPALKPLAKLAFGVYLAVTMPTLVVVSVLMGVRLPAVVTTGIDSLQLQVHALSAALAHGDVAFAVLAAIQMLMIVLPAVGFVYLIYSVGRVCLSAWRRASLPTRLRGAPRARLAP